MLITEYIEKYFDISTAIREAQSNPIKQIMELDDLKYDRIEMYDGRLQKVLELNDTDVISVLELIAYTPEQIEQLAPDDDLRVLYDNYMKDIEISDLSFYDIQESARRWLREKGVSCID